MYDAAIQLKQQITQQLAEVFHLRDTLQQLLCLASCRCNVPLPGHIGPSYRDFKSFDGTKTPNLRVRPKTLKPKTSLSYPVFCVYGFGMSPFSMLW